MRQRWFVRLYAYVISAALVFLALTTVGFAQTYTVLYNFGSNANDPSAPAYSGIIAQGRDGNLYSTAPGGGANGNGAVFKITPAGMITLLYSFDGTHGNLPLGGLTLGTDGNFYGTTHGGGASNAGTIFKITPAGSLTTLFSFNGGSTGSNPYAPPVQGSDGNWYGTTNAGGGFNFGTVYKLTTAGVFTSIYSFDGSHGFNPRDPLVLGTDNNLYGTTLYGGSTEQGNVFKVTNAGVVTGLYNFDNTHGEFPSGSLIQALDGNFYGTTEAGGTSGAGVVFKITPSGSLTVLHNMNGTTDGSVIEPGVVQGSDGALYGVAGPVSTANGGTIFRATTTGTLTVPYSFPADGSKGQNPQVTPVQHTNGILYGLTAAGGSGNVSPCTTGACGVFYSLNNNLPAFIKPLPYSGKVGSKIGILGQGFSASSVVKFNGVTATTVTLTGTTFLLATVPAGASDGYVTVTTGTTTLKSLRKFTVHNSWSSGAVLPTAVEFPAAGTIGAKIYVVGGVTSSALVATNQVYSPASNTWTTAAPIPTAVSGAASAVVSGLLYVIGGYTSTGGNLTGAVQVYNPTTNSWTTKTAMPTARGSAAAVVDGGMIYVIGGNGSSLRLNTVEKYNPATDTWSTEAPLLTGKSEPSAGLLGSTIVAAGGYTTSEDTGDNEGYNVSTNKWSALTFDPTPRNASCFGSLLGQLYLAGGGANGSQQTLTESFSAGTNKWTTQASMPQATIAPGSAVSGGLLYCFGGSSTGVALSGTVYNNVQIYQP
jgi:uncharacterized repeat protein (TIGR03803 family)